MLALAVACALGACGFETDPCPASCDPHSAELAQLTYQQVQALAEDRGECILVCYASIARVICPEGLACPLPLEYPLGLDEPPPDPDGYGTSAGGPAP